VREFIADPISICYGNSIMRKKKFKIIPERRVGKTRVLYNGPARELEKLRTFFGDKKSSDAYPALQAGYESAVFFYHTDEQFLRRLYRYCKDNLSALAKQKAGLDFAKLFVQLLTLGGIGLVIYFVYGLIVFILNAMKVVG
jgi:hypothetical protein